LASTAIGYIGLLGPAARRDRLLGKMGQLAVSLRDRVSGPVGLDIGAKLPEEIGIAIMSEIVAHLRQCQSSSTPETLHARMVAG
jgi:xanthine dehydrogenase accessory factor